MAKVLGEMPTADPTVAEALDAERSNGFQGSDQPMTTTMTTEAILAEIRAHHRERRFAMNVRKKVDNATLSYLRGQLDWNPKLPEAESNRIKAAAFAALKAGEAVAPLRRAGKPYTLSDPVYAANQAAINLAVDARVQFDAYKKKSESAMGRLVRQLPVWKTWGTQTSGVGEKVLGGILGECGDLSNYPTVAKLWKRMGLGVVDDVRQGNPGKGATAEDWVRHGYSGERRSILFNFSAAVIKNGGPYRASTIA